MTAVLAGLLGVAGAMDLDTAIQVAEQHNLELRLAREEAARAEASRAEVRAAHLSRLSITSRAGLNAFEVDVPGEVLPFEATRPLVRRERLEAVATFTQPLFRPSVWVGIAAARAAERGAEARVARVRQDVRVATTGAFADLAVARRRAALAVEAVAIDELAARDAVRRFEQGLATKRDVHQANLAVLRATRELAAARAGVAVAEQGFTTVVGRAAPEVLELSDDAEPLPLTLAEARAHTRRRPDVQAFEARVVASQRQAHAARLGGLPTLDLAIQGRLNATPTLIDPLPASGTAGVVLRWTPLEGGQRAARVRRFDSELREAMWARDAARTRVQAEVEVAWASLQEARAAVTLAKAAFALAEDDLLTAQRSHAAGIADDTDLRRAQLAVERARLEAARAVEGQRLAGARLGLAMGRPGS